MTSIPVLLGDGPDRIPRDWEIMPFRFLFGPRANLGILLILFVLILGFACSLVGLAHAYGATDPRSLEIYKLIGLCAIGLGQIAVLIRSQGNAEGIRKTRHEIKGDLQAQTLLMQEVAQKTNGGLHKAVKEVGDQVRAAEREQVINDPTCRQAIEEIAGRAADRAARMVYEAMKQEATKDGPRA